MPYIEDLDVKNAIQSIYRLAQKVQELIVENKALKVENKKYQQKIKDLNNFYKS